jgi:uncharacterized protein (DUF305 family)
MNDSRTLTRTTTWAIAAALAVLLIIAAAAGKQRTQAQQAEKGPSMPGPIDIGFAQSMARHHRQAIGMSKLMLDGRPTPLAPLANAIADAQLLELGEMQGWLRLWDQPWMPQERQMDWMLLGRAAPDAALRRYLIDCQRSPTGMPGMATDAELDALRRLEGRARDDRFLELMIAHHDGAAPMARFAAREASLPAVRRLAARMVLEQAEETSRMWRMREALARAHAAQPAATAHTLAPSSLPSRPVQESAR